VGALRRDQLSLQLFLAYLMVCCICVHLLLFWTLIPSLLDTAKSEHKVTRLALLSHLASIGATVLWTHITAGLFDDVQVIAKLNESNRDGITNAGFDMQKEGLI